jgi:hypothetical protein
MPRYDYCPSQAKPVWSPLHKSQLRSQGADVRINAKLSGSLLKLKYEFGSIRELPILQSFGTERWFQRCPEQMNTGFRTHQGHTLLLEMAHTIRAPKGFRPYYYRMAMDPHDSLEELEGALEAYFDVLEQRKEGIADELDVQEADEDWHDALDQDMRALSGISGHKRKPDFFIQHTRPWRYCMDNPDHIRAYYNLLNYCGSYVAGQKNPGVFTDLYIMDIGERRELARWPMSGLVVYNEQWKDCTYRGDGWEVLDVVCDAGIKPKRPWECMGERPKDPKLAAHYDHVLRCWEDGMRYGKKRIGLKLRRIVHDQNGQEERAWYLNDAHEFDIPIHAVECMDRYLANWWDAAVQIIKDRSTRKESRCRKLFMSCKYWAVRRHWRQPKDEWNYVEGTPSIARMPYRTKFHPDFLKLTSTIIKKALDQSKPAHGMFLVPWTSGIEPESKDFFLRMALYDEGLVRWSPFWSLSEEEAAQYVNKAKTTRMWSQRLSHVVGLFVALMLTKWRKRRAKEDREWVVRDFIMIKNPVVLSNLLVRGPPAHLFA